ncbi:hypothetical protein Gbth_001_038 [Gluconobacter thailandicus F149-1 = NBRC 100600]|nr:hypothetical protein Gbth_001_038 [Gluconobacter thailandicus F149-1 = NBRC 100600]GBR59749.1 hypothetical protein AA100600_1469 [Gluconobacter thailandicus F149-1 = NBRC 100600]GEL86782.1 hypothetical protein GTH01_11400 [Gluconobacter thailandicus F149-1 = NBRC 100600]
MVWGAVDITVIMVVARVAQAVIAKVVAEAAAQAAIWAAWATAALEGECDLGTRLRPGFLLPCQ